MKRALIFSLAYYPGHVGGAEVAIKEITDRISDIEFLLITLRFDRKAPASEKIGNVTVYRIGFGIGPIFFNKLLAPFWGAWTALALKRRYTIHVFWAVMVNYVTGAAYIANALHFWKRVPVILTLQEGDSEEHLTTRHLGLIDRAWRLALSRTDFLTAISTYLKDRALRIGYRGPAMVIPNGVDIAHFSQEFSRRETGVLKRQLGKKEGDVYLMTTSRLVPKNACDDVIRALAKLPESVHFIVFGEGADEHMLRKLAKEKGVAHRVHFFGFMSHEELPKYLAVADIFIRPSRSEGMGNSFVEAMAAGVPVIATQEGGIADFLFDAKHNPDKQTTGWAVEKDSPEQIVEAVNDVLTSKQRARRIAVNARKLVNEKYGWNLIARDMREQVFSAILK